MEPSDLDDLIRRYAAGEGIRKLAQRFHRDDLTIRRLLTEAGVMLRTPSEANSAKWRVMPAADKAAHAERTRDATAEHWAGLTEEQRARRAANMAAAPRRLSPPLSVVARERIAATRERTLGEVGREELAVAAALLSLGIVTTPQKAVGTYNLDIAVNAMPVAVEIDTGHFYRVVRGERLCRNRLEYLLDRGWCVVFVTGWFGRTDRLNAARVVEKVVALCDVASRDKTVFGQYGVINGQGNAVAGERSYLDGFARVPGF